MANRETDKQLLAELPHDTGRGQVAAVSRNRVSLPQQRFDREGRHQHEQAFRSKRLASIESTSDCSR